jgi:hypothetical protein
VILHAFLLAASPALAVIVVTLENPGDGQDVSGNTGISGQVFSDIDAEVTVKLRIDGEIVQEAGADLEIPCCGPRQDVVDSFGVGTPLNTCFSPLFNYGLLAAGVHTIGVEVCAPGEDTVIVDHVVVIAKPGDAELLTSFSLADANIAIDGNEIVITGAVVDSARTNLRASYSTSSQSLVITEANIEEALVDG